MFNFIAMNSNISLTNSNNNNNNNDNSYKDSVTLPLIHAFNAKLYFPFIINKIQDKFNSLLN